MNAPRHPEDQLPLLALDLLTPEEQATLKLHLDTCLECQEHLRQFTATLAVLPLAASESQPSPSLRQRIVTAAGSTPQPASIHRKAEHRPSTSTHHRWRMLSGWIAAAALIVLTALLGLRDLTLQNEMTLLRQAQPIHLALTATTSAPQASGEVLFGPQTPAALAVSHLMPPPEGKVYEAWVISKSKPIPAGTFTTTPTGTGALLLTVTPQSGDIIAITVEPAPETQKPTGPVLLKGVIPST